jgi:hypothetical protein
VQDTSTASTSAFSTEVRIPFLQEDLLVLHDYLADIGEFVAAKATIVRQGNRLKPELRITTGVSNMNVGRLSSLETVEEESVSPNPQDCRHWASLPRIRWPIARFLDSASDLPRAASFSRLLARAARRLDPMAPLKPAR